MIQQGNDPEVSHKIPTWASAGADDNLAGCVPT